MLEPLYTADEMRSAEERYPGYPGSIPELMERAGTAVAREAIAAYPNARRFACVCGGGANGGDGRVAARVLREAGLAAAETEDVEGSDVVVDALFGTGFHGEPRPRRVRPHRAHQCRRRTSRLGGPPSGVDASTGEIAGAVVDAELTVTFHGRKIGLEIAPAASTPGGSWSRTSGSTTSRPSIGCATAALLDLVPLRRAGDTKYTAGAVLVVGGSRG